MNSIRASAVKGIKFTNWSETFSCTPELVFMPKTSDELVEILQIAKQDNKKVKVVGCGHSPSDIACTNDYMINLRNFNKVISVSEEKLQITVQAGMTLKELNEIHLPKHNLALSVLGSISDITVGGAISTGTHGTGIKYGLLSTYVVDLELLTSEGKCLRCSKDENEEIFLAALCSLGCLGIILTATIQCEKAFSLIQNQYGIELKEIIEHLDVHLQASDHFRFMWFPYTEFVVVSHLTRIKMPVSKQPWWGRLYRWFWDYAMGYYLLEFCYYISTYFPQIVPTINRTFYSFVFSRSKKYVDVSHKVFNFECLFKQHVTEWAISKEKAGVVLCQLKEWIENNKDVHVHFPVEVRFAKGDNILISPTHGRDTCYINIIMYRPYGLSVPYQKYWSAFEKIMEDAGGRPHWAKAHSITAQKFTGMYKEFNRWCSIRSELDPLNMFLNPYLERILQ